MQVLFLPVSWTLALCAVVWFAFQLGVALACQRLPEEWLNPDGFLFREHRWERSGRLYARLDVHRWKQWLPEGAAISRSGYRKRMLRDYSPESLDRFLVDSCRAELTHIVAILPFWVFGLFGPPRIILYMLIFELIVNLPFIITQRYNRPRVRALREKLRARAAGST